MTATVILAEKPVHLNTIASPVQRTWEIDPRSKKIEEQNTAGHVAPTWHFTETIEYEGRTFQLTHPLAVRFQLNSEHMWEASLSKLGIIGVGPSTTIAFNELQEEFAVFWDGLAFESDDQLTLDAQQLKATLRQLVK